MCCWLVGTGKVNESHLKHLGFQWPHNRWLQLVAGGSYAAGASLTGEESEIQVKASPMPWVQGISDSNTGNVKMG